MTDPKPDLTELELREALYEAMDGNLRMSRRRELLGAYRDAILASAVSAVVPAADRAAEDLAKHVARAIYALKSPTPPGSEHYRSGWDDGLEAAMDAARDAVLRLAAVPVVGVAADTTSAAERPRCPDCGLPHDLTPSMAIACASIRSMVDTVAPAVEPGPMVPAQPGNDTKTPRRCPHQVDEHSVYGCVDGCGCEWMPRRTPQ